MNSATGSNPSILWHSGIWGAADEAVLNKVLTKNIPVKKNILNYEMFSILQDINGEGTIKKLLFYYAR
jgi:hypothetical protein